MIRSILAVLGGFAATVALVMASTLVLVYGLLGGPDGDPTPTYIAANLGFSALAGIVGGWVAAFIGDQAPMRHALALAVVLLGLSVLTGEGGASDAQPLWYLRILTALGPMSVLIGGWIRARSVAATGTRAA